MPNAYHFVVFVIALVTFVFGLFGNIMIIWAVRKHSDLRTKHGVLLSFLCFYQSLVLMHNLVISFRNLFDDITNRQTCFYFLLPQSFFYNAQLVLVLVISLDLAFLVFRPTKYNTVQLFPYTILVQIPSASFALAITIAGTAIVRSDKVLWCDFASSLPVELNLIWNLSSIGVCVAIILVYALISFAMWFRDWQNTRKTDGACVLDPSLRYQRKMMRTLSILMTAFFCTCFVSSVLFLIPNFVPSISNNETAYVRSAAVEIGLLSCAQNYYIYYKMSKDFQKAFRKIIASIKKWKKKKIQTVQVKKATVSNAVS